MDIGDEARLTELTQGIDTVLHFAWIKDKGIFLVKCSGNVSGAYKLFEAAVQNGVRRIIFASSNHTTGYYKTYEMVGPQIHTVRIALRTQQMLYRALGRLYSDQGKISSFNIRLATFLGTIVLIQNVRGISGYPNAICSN